MKRVAAAVLFVLIANPLGWAIPDTPELPVLPANLVKNSPLIPSSAEPRTIPVLAEEKRKSPAYQQYKKRPVSDLSKLIYLGDRLKESGLLIVHDHVTYEPKKIAPLVTLYVRMNYKKEKVDEWILKHAYRNGSTFAVIFIKNLDGSLTPLRDYLLQELKTL